MKGFKYMKTCKALARGTNHWTSCWTTYVMNGFRFHVKSNDVEGNTQNSAVFVKVETDNYATARDHNPRAVLLDYYGAVKHIIEMDHLCGRKVVLFNCDWIDGRVRN